MKIQDFKKEVIALAELNSSLTKGYGREWKPSDYDGYENKNKLLKELVNKAKENKFPVLYDKVSSVVYFIFGKIKQQISFHTVGDSFGLPHTNVDWDGVRNSHKYSESQISKLRLERKKECQKRKVFRAKKESELVDFANNYILMLEVKKKRSKTEKTKTEIDYDILKIKERLNRPYGLYEYFRYVDGAKELCYKLLPTFSDSYNECVVG